MTQTRRSRALHLAVARMGGFSAIGSARLLLEVGSGGAACRRSVHHSYRLLDQIFGVVPLLRSAWPGLLLGEGLHELLWGLGRDLLGGGDLIQRHIHGFRRRFRRRLLRGLRHGPLHL